MAYKPYYKDTNNNLKELPLYAEKADKDGAGNDIPSTYATKTELNSYATKTELNNGLSAKADLSNSSQQIVANKVSGTTGDFTNINNSISSINTSISNINSALSKKDEIVSYGSVTLTGKVSVSGWYIKRQISLGGTIRYEFEVCIPTHNFSTVINQNSDTSITLSGLPAFNGMVYEPIVIAIQTSPGPTNDYMNSQSIQYSSCNGSAGTITLRARRAYSESYTYLNIYIKGIMS